MADLRFDASTGRWVAVAPGRTRRPGATAIASDEREDCPFCAGHEDRTPPETLLLGDGPTGWDVRVVPNLYPALERQEVVVHGPEHVHSIAELSGATLDLVAEAWQRRAHDAGGICFPFVNEGHDAGASLPHSHSQLAWLPAAPPAAVAEHGLPELVPVLERDGLVAGCPVASRVAYELLVYPERGEPAGLRSDLLGPGAQARRRARRSPAHDPRRLRADQRLAARGGPLAPRGLPAHQPARGARARCRGVHRPRRARDGSRRARAAWRDAYSASS